MNLQVNRSAPCATWLGVSFMKSMFIKYRYAVLSSVVLIGMVLYISGKRIPIPTGESGDFWKFACGVEVKSFDGYFPYAHEIGIFPSQEGWYFYYFQEHHGRHVFKVNEDSLLLDVNEVFVLLEENITSTKQEKTREDYLYESNKKRLVCLEIKNAVGSDPNRFIDSINMDVTDRDESFREEWELSKRYWVSIVFEAIFIPFWWIFSFHSGILGKLNNKREIRIAFSPLLLFLPHFLGYAPYLFSFGPSGGILYPLFAGLMSLPFGWIPFNPIEISILQYLPQPLSYISQVPFSPMAMSFYGSVSPTALCAYAGLILMLSKAISKYRKR